MHTIKSIKTTFATISLLVVFIFACAAYIAKADSQPAASSTGATSTESVDTNLTPQQRFQKLQSMSDTQRQHLKQFMESHGGKSTSSPFFRHGSSTPGQFASSTFGHRPEFAGRGTSTGVYHKAALSAHSQQRITDLAANISNRVDAAVARFRQISDRLQSRIGKLQAEGADTTTAQQHLDAAIAAVNGVSSSTANIDTAVAGVVGSTDPRTAWQSVRSTFESAKQGLMTAEKELQASVAALKDAVKAAGIGSGASAAVRQGQGAPADTSTTTSGTGTSTGSTTSSN